MSEKNSTPVDAPVETADVKTVTFQDLTFEVRADVFNDLDVLEAWEDGKHVALCRAILGPVQWSKFRSTKRPVEDLYLLLGELISVDEDAS